MAKTTPHSPTSPRSTRSKSKSASPSPGYDNFSGYSPTEDTNFRKLTAKSKSKARGKDKGKGPIALVPKVASRAVERVKKEVKVKKGGKTKGGSGKKV